MQKNLLSSSVCLFVKRFVLQGLSMLRSVKARPIIGLRESYHFKLNLCRKTFMFSLEQTSEIKA